MIHCFLFPHPLPHRLTTHASPPENPCLEEPSPQIPRIQNHKCFRTDEEGGYSAWVAVRRWEDLKEDGQELVVSMGENSLGCTSSHPLLQFKPRNHHFVNFCGEVRRQSDLALVAAEGGSARSWSKKGWLRSCSKEILSFAVNQSMLYLEMNTGN